MQYIGWVLFLVFMALGFSTQAGNAPQSADSIRAAIEAVVNAELQQSGTDYRIEPVRVNSRLRLTECEHPLDAFILSGQRGSGYFSVGVRCTGISPWTTYHSVKATLYQTVVVLKEPVRQGVSIQPDMLLLEKRELTGQHGGYFTDPAAPVGQIAKRTLPGGLLLTPDHLTQALAVQRGQSVSIRAKSADFEIAMPGVALGDGHLGQRIRARNTQSGRVVEGIITQPGIVSVD
ncbi:MAG: flagellar basal body P-ring formation chaperone FlgA [Methylococcaceae bacterium]